MCANYKYSNNIRILEHFLYPVIDKIYPFLEYFHIEGLDGVSWLVVVPPAAVNAVLAAQRRV